MNQERPHIIVLDSLSGLEELMEESNDQIVEATLRYLHNLHQSYQAHLNKLKVLTLNEKHKTQIRRAIQTNSSISGQLSLLIKPNLSPNKMLCK